MKQRNKVALPHEDSRTAGQATPQGSVDPRRQSARKSDAQATDDELDVSPLSPPSSRAAFLPDPEEGPAHVADDAVEDMAEQYLQSATSGIDSADASREEPTIEEEGGPYVTTSAAEELAEGTDASNPKGSDPAPFPTSQSES